MISVYIVEDDAITRNSLSERVSMDGRCTVEIAVGTCREIREALLRDAPDVLLVDLGLPDGNGINVIAEAATRYPQLSIMVITVFGDEKRVVAAIKAGATGYLLKDDKSSDISTAIHQLIRGESPISPAIARHLVRLFAIETVDVATPQSNRLTSREHEVLKLAAKGFSHAEMAEIMGISNNTVASYTKRIYEKLSVNSRAQAIYEAARLGLLDRT